MTSPDSQITPSPRVLFACGGTGGHVYPAIAIADAVRELDPDAAIAFAGTEDRMEWTAVPKAGYPIHAITVSGFQRGLSGEALKRNLTFPFKLGKGLWESFKLVGAFDADVVVGTGGYVSGPVGVASKLRGRGLAIQEQNAFAGATNRLLAKLADRVFAAFRATDKQFPEEKVTVSGNPTRADLTEADRAEALKHWGFPDDARVLVVMGGSLGAGPVNDALENHLDALLQDERVHVVWQSGSRYVEALKGRLGERAEHPRLRLLEYIDRMDLAYAAADLAVCRAGAITCSELAVTHTPAVLVPSPNVVADHQTHNARALSEPGAAVLLPEPRLEAELVPTVTGLLADAGRLKQMAEAAQSVARPDAAMDIARGVLEIARAQRGAASPNPSGTPTAGGAA